MAHWLTALLLLSAAAAANAQAPYRAYSVLLGGIGWDDIKGVAVDGAGQTWLVGTTSSEDFPFTDRPDGGLHYGVFIARLSPAGELLSAIPFGGSAPGMVDSIHLDAAGNLYLAGTTLSPDFPMTTRLGPPGATSWAFVAKLDRDGDLVYSTGIGGTPYLAMTDLAVDAEGQAYMLGHTPISAHAGAWDMVITKLSADGSRLLYSVQLGGSSFDIPREIAVDSAGNAHVAGYTHSTDFPHVQRLPENGAAGFPEAVVVKLSPDGSRLIYATLLGGGGWDAAGSIAIDPAGNALVYGVTTSTDFPVRNALQSQPNPDTGWYSDAFLTRLDPAGALLDSTYFGGSGDDSAVTLAVDPAGFIYLLGASSSTDFPLRDPLPIDGLPIPTLYQYMAYVTRLDPRASEVLFSTFLDGTEKELGWAYGMTLDAAGNVYVVGASADYEFPVVGPSPRTHPWYYDAFAVKIDLGLGRAPDCSAATATPTTIWPPDGRMVPVVLSGVTDPDGDPVSVAVTAVFQDEPLSKKGQPDAAGLGTAEPRVRASRAGSGDGRVYHLTFTATDPRGASCTGAVTVCVPHDQGQRSTCGDGGRLVDSISGRYPPPPTWTVWLNRDYPSGTGDGETVAEFRAEGNNICNGATPIGIECQTLSGVDWKSTGQAYTCNATTGGVCLNSRQPGGDCMDYRVRFLCP